MFLLYRSIIHIFNFFIHYNVSGLMGLGALIPRISIRVTFAPQGIGNGCSREIGREQGREFFIRFIRVPCSATRRCGDILVHLAVLLPTSMIVWETSLRETYVFERGLRQVRVVHITVPQGHPRSLVKRRSSTRLWSLTGGLLAF